MKLDLIGNGYSGRRFLQAADFATTSRGEPLTTEVFSRESPWKVTENIQEDFNVVVNATSDDQHFSVLSQLNQGYDFLISEKPLIKPDEDVPLDWLDRWENKDNFALNCIERYSAAIDYVKSFQQQSSMKLVRINFVWAKNRFDDPRRTIGVISEIIHPLDLCCFLLDSHASDFQLDNSHVVASDYSSFDDEVPETAQISAQLNGCFITGYSSFAHPDRSRIFELTFVDPHGGREYIQITFDEPRWDYDKLKHWGDRTDSNLMVAEYETGSGSPATCGKLSRFISDVRYGSADRRYADFSQALALHSILQNISAVGVSKNLHFTYGRGEARRMLDRENLERLG